MQKKCRVCRTGRRGGVKCGLGRLIEAEAVLTGAQRAEGRGYTAALQGVSVSMDMLRESESPVNITCCCLFVVLIIFPSPSLGQSIDPPVRQKCDCQCPERSGSGDRPADHW